MGTIHLLLNMRPIATAGVRTVHQLIAAMLRHHVDYNLHGNLANWHLLNILSGFIMPRYRAGGELNSGTLSLFRGGNLPSVVRNVPFLKDLIVFTHVSEVEYTKLPSIQDVPMLI